MDWNTCYLLGLLWNLVVIVGRGLNVLDVSVDAVHDIFLHNVSLGLNNNIHLNKCIVQGKLEEPKALLTYTPNRRTQEETISDAINQRLKLAVILAVGGHSDSHYNYGPFGSVNGLLSVWDSWIENFFSRTSNTTSLILLFDQRDFLRQNMSKTKEEYLSNILEKNMGATPVYCVRLRHKGVGANQVDYKTRHHRRKGEDELKKDTVFHNGCGNELHLDQGYRVYSIQPSSLGNSTVEQPIRPLLIFASIYDFPLAEWVKREEEEKLFKEWKPFRLNRRYPTNYGYVKMTNWYSYYMLTLKLLDFFDYGGKLDNDVSFVAPFPEPNLPLKLAKHGSYVLNTANGWYHDDPRICQGVSLCLNSFMRDEAKHCITPHKRFELIPRGTADDTFWQTNFNTTFRSHFLVFWLGLYTSPETMRLSKYWNDFHPRGMWDYRWGDQQWWPRPIAMFGNGNLSKEILHYDEINTDNEKYVVHKLWPRWMTIAKTDYFHVNGSTKESRQRLYEIAAKQFK